METRKFREGDNGRVPSTTRSIKRGVVFTASGALRLQ